MKRIFCAGLLALLALPQAYADEVRVSKAWVRATAPGQDTASVQLNITSRRDAALIRVASGSAQSGEIHGMAVEGDATKMRRLEELPLPAKTTVSLGAESNRLMLIGLKNPLVAGKKLPFALTVRFADGKKTTIRVLAVIKPLEAAGGSGT